MIYNNLAYGFRKIIKTSVTLMVITMVLAACSCFAYDEILKLQELAVNWPVELLALCGMSSAFGLNASLMVFYILITLFNIAAIACCAGMAVSIIRQDDRNGMIIHYLNQPFNKLQIFTIKLILSILFALFQWLLYILFLGASVYFICMHFDISFANEWSHIISIATNGLPILLLALAICLLYAIVSANRMGYVYYLITTFSFSLLIGNAYKIFDLIAYYMRSGQIDDSTIVSISETLKKLRLFFPFTLLNRLNTEKAPLPPSAMSIYVVISILLLGLCGYMYMTKSIENND